MTIHTPTRFDFFNLHAAHTSWQPLLRHALSKVDPIYLQQLAQSNDWLPGPNNIFNAFSLPLNQVNYLLLGESPYPRRESANGYAFWDAAVNDLWSATGLSKKVNRATSLRNIIKMLLVAEDLLDTHTHTQEAIAHLDKKLLVKTNQEFFHNLIAHGFLLLNATLVLQPAAPPQKDARAWYPFIKAILDVLLEKRPHIKFILLGRIAFAIEPILQNHHQPLEKLYAEHPYNHSFITNPKILSFFKPLHLLKSA